MGAWEQVPVKWVPMKQVPVKQAPEKLVPVKEGGLPSWRHRQVKGKAAVDHQRLIPSTECLGERNGVNGDFRSSDLRQQAFGLGDVRPVEQEEGFV